jgi:hypothetical protein
MRLAQSSCDAFFEAYYVGFASAPTGGSVPSLSSKGISYHKAKSSYVTSNKQLILKLRNYPVQQVEYLRAGPKIPTRLPLQPSKPTNNLGRRPTRAKRQPKKPRRPDAILEDGALRARAIDNVARIRHLIAVLIPIQLKPLQRADDDILESHVAEIAARERGGIAAGERGEDVSDDAAKVAVAVVAYGLLVAVYQVVRLAVVADVGFGGGVVGHEALDGWAGLGAAGVVCFSNDGERGRLEGEI